MRKTGTDTWTVWLLTINVSKVRPKPVRQILSDDMKRNQSPDLRLTVD